MDKYIIKTFNLEPNSNDITPIDRFKLYRDFDAYIAVLRDYASKNALTDVEQFYYDVQTDPRCRFFHQLDQNYFNNYFLSIYFILTNSVLITKPTFANLYRERHLLPDITDHIIHLYETMDAKTSRFFNKTLLEKFVSNLEFTPLPDDITGQEYNEYFTLFVKETARLKAYLIELLKDPKWSKHPEQGLSEFEPELFRFAFEYHTGLKLQASDDFLQIKQWAQKHLDHLMQEVDQTCNRLLTDESDKHKSVYEKMILIGNHSTQRWSSKQEMIDAHQACIAKYRQIFITQYQFKEFLPPALTILDNPFLAGGYYDKGHFYLNVAHCAEGNFKYEVENLTLHETIPGHHLQLDISKHSPHQNHLTEIVMEPCNGFCEGWALFAEHLGDAMLDDPWIYFGYLQSNILRTFRIIAEILLHVEGQTPEQVVELAKQYITTSEGSLTAEIYRYRVHPGQACSYKIGLEVFKRIIEKMFNVLQMQDLLKPNLVEWYKEVLWQASRPLEVLLKENGVTWSFD